MYLQMQSRRVWKFLFHYFKVVENILWGTWYLREDLHILLRERVDECVFTALQLDR